jgi:hypothetical protein
MTTKTKATEQGVSKPFEKSNKQKLDDKTFNALMAEMTRKNIKGQGKGLSEYTLADLTKHSKQLGFYQDVRMSAVKDWRKETGTTPSKHMTKARG